MIADLPVFLSSHWQPANFYLARGLRCAWQFEAEQTIPWELFRGHLLDPQQARAYFPFERVKQIQVDADQRLLARQKDLERKVQDAQQRLGELQKAKTEGSEELVTADQRKEREKVRDEFVQARRALRDVEHQRRKDTERLGTTLKVLNIAVVPALVCVTALFLGAARIRRRTRK